MIIQHNLTACLLIACKDAQDRKRFRKEIAASMVALEKKLKLRRNEVLHVFYSPHCAPRGLRMKILPAFRFVRPDQAKLFNRDVIKAAAWVEAENRITAELKLPIFLSPGTHPALSDNHPFKDDATFGKEVFLMMRRGKVFGCYMGREEAFVESEVFPLLKKPR